jgi:hypothetical protein
MSNPDYREGSAVVSSTAKLRFGQVRRAVMRALIGHGVGAQEVRFGADTWDVVNLPLGGRMKITGSRLAQAQNHIYRWVRQREERRHWGATAQLEVRGKDGISVRLTLDDFAMIVGTLQRLLNERRRWLDGPAVGEPDHDSGGGP